MLTGTRTEQALSRGRAVRDVPFVLLNRVQPAVDACMSFATTSFGNSKASVTPFKSPKEKEADPGFHWWYSNSRCHETVAGHSSKSKAFSVAALF